MFLKRLHMNRTRFLRYRFPDRPRRSPFVPVSKTQGPEVSSRPEHTSLSLKQLKQKRQARKRVSRDPNAILSAATELGVLEERIGYKFENKLLGIAAFKTHNSTKLDLDGKKTFFEDQKRLALLGDEVLDLAICRTWYYSRRSRVLSRRFVAQNTSSLARSWWQNRPPAAP
ncbi:hypothetical protein C7974DRAFT_58799 [Boeremia exigua]|uniref:uncharacterized protein n=1 Tax=Boeremia exigua TaxID=749465 RepID=UPI001E8D0023|nr:uncharacterized protein C7974DRAFT_58799 [Boeremia exigua]KAH6615082.1 hypothetical protein C7974DRAFT_58799 [Boeremia exigua]